MRQSIGSTRHLIVSLLVTIFAVASCTKAVSNEAPLNRVPSMDLTRVPGDWYLAARYPTIFDRVAVSGKVTLTATNFVDMDVKWSFLKSPDASERSTWNLELSAGTGKNTTLWSLTPVWPLKATVHVVEVSGDYSWLVLGSPDRRLLWILTKKEQEDPLLIAGLIERLGQNGFDTTAIVVEKPKD